MIKYTFSIAVLLTFAMAVQAPAQTCQPETAIPSSTPASRFTDNGDGTVTDTATGLMWARCPEGLSGADCSTGGALSFTWEGALDRAQASVLAGYDDWRLPNIKELSSIVEERCWDPAVNLAVFPGTTSYAFRSASPYRGAVYYAWFVHFYNGGAGGSDRANNLHVRLVRSGQ